jgi:hypothetical protein
MDRKKSFQTALGFGAIMSIFFISQNLFDKDPLTIETAIIAVLLGLLAGAISGLLYAGLLRLFFKSTSVTSSVTFHPDADEIILFETGANHFKGAEGVGGRLYLTNKRLFFKSHKFNIQRHEYSLPLSAIEKVERYQPLPLTNNGLKLHTTTGSIEKFVVEQTGEWLMHLKDKGTSP